MAKKTKKRSPKRRITFNLPDSHTAPRAELQNGSVVYQLGDSPAYAHSYVTYMRAGTKTAAKMFDSEVASHISGIKALMAQQIDNLNKREQELYKLLNISNFVQFRTVWQKMLEKQIGANDMSVGDAIQCLLDMKQISLDLVTAKNNGNGYNQEQLKRIYELVQQIKPFYGDSSPAQAILKDKLPFFETDANGALVAIKDEQFNGWQFAAHLGTLMEYTLVPLVESNVEQQLGQLQQASVSGRQVGKQRKQGAGDVAYTFKNAKANANEASLEVRMTVKTRAATFYDKNKQALVWQSRFGSGQSNLTYKNAFFNNAQLAKPINSRLDALLSYLLVNYSMFAYRSDIAEQDTFIRDVKSLLAFEYAIFGVLGENWANAAQTVPLFYLSGGEIYQTQAILKMLKDSSDITQYTNKSYGSWMSKSAIGAMGYYDVVKEAKKQFLKRMNENGKDFGYADIKADTEVRRWLQEMENEWKTKQLFAIKYKIADRDIPLF